MSDKYGDKMKKCITLFDALTDDERIIVMDGYNSSTGKKDNTSKLKLKKMNKTIWKFELETTDNQTIEMPVNAEILTVQTQNEIPCIWALVDPTQVKEKRFIEVFGTGHDVHYDMGVSRNYLGTYQLHGGSLVFHVFEYTGV